MDFEVTNALTQQNPKQIDEEFTTTAYPSVQENLRLPTEDQDTSSVPLMTTPVIDLIMSQPVSTTVQAPLPTSTTTVTAITTTTSLPPPPPQPQKAQPQIRSLDHTLEQVPKVSDDQTSPGISPTQHLLDSKKNWWKPLPEEERPTTLKPAWIILPSNVLDVENKWASALSSSYEPPA
ncbi:hypothetical protein Tco_0085620 [Tanacetum coccineum]